MKNIFKTAVWLSICLLSGTHLFTVAALAVGQGKNPSPLAAWHRYEDKLVGFSIQYDAEKFSTDPGQIGPFVFRREAPGGFSGLGVTVGPYPPGTALKDTAGLIVGSLPGMIPGLIIRQVHNQQIIKLADGTRANYFELEGDLGGTKLRAAFVAAQKDDQLFVYGASDLRGGPQEHLKGMVRTLRFDVEVDQAALKARGFASDGLFVRTDPPAFTLKFPKAFRNRRLMANQIFRAGIPQNSPSMSISIWSFSPGQDTPEQLVAMAKGYANSLKSVGSDIKIISQNPIAVYQPYDACEVQVVWRYRGGDTLTTLVRVIAKKDKAILLAGHTIYGTDELIDIFKTVNLDP